jgi:hypothetical protein
MYRPGAGGDFDRRSSGKRAEREQHSWSASKDQLRRTVNHAPEVVINVKGSRLAKNNDRMANKGVLRYMMYISRNGRLLTINERDDPLDGPEAIRETHASWDLEMQRMRGAKGEALHPSFNIIFSMPAKTDPDIVLEAVQALARDHFSGHQYVMALHTQDTDPSNDPPEHPHVHLILRAENEDGVRIHIRKTTLRIWRDQFAAELRARGIEANATSRAERGKSLKAVRGAEWHIQKRYEQDLRKGKHAVLPRAKTARYLDAARAVRDGLSESKPWEIAMAARRRDILRELVRNAGRLRQEGDVEFADQVDRYISELPPLDTESRHLQRELVQQVQRRLRERTQDNSKNRLK